MTATALRAEERVAAYLVAPSLTEHLDTFTSAPEGFKRLRKLVLNLAVRGRLVDQKDDDAKLSIGSKTLPAGDTPFGIPQSWHWARIGEVLTLINGRAFKPTEWLPSGLPIVRIQNLNNAAAPFNYCNKTTVDDRHVIDSGAFLISWSGTPGTSFGAFVWARGRAALNQHIFKCEFASQEIDPAYLRLAINGRLDEMIAKAHGGVGLQHITKGKLEHLALPLPPFAEQSRIVAKVEELMALIARLEAKVGAGDTARGKLLDILLAALAASPDAATAEAWAQLAPHFDLLLQTPADVDRLQQTLLTLAVKGRLVPQDPKDEPAAELLKRIRAEKDRLIDEGKIKRDKPLLGIDDDVPHELPAEWSWARVGQVMDVETNLVAPADYLDWPQVAPDLIEKGTGKLIGSRTVAVAEIKSPNHLFRSGQIIYSKIRPSLSKAVIATFDGLCSADMYPLTARINSQYALLYILSQGFLEQVAIAENRVKMPKLNQEALTNFLFPLPPLAEQPRIAAAVASLTALCDRLRERLAARRELSGKLAAALTESALA